MKVSKDCGMKEKQGCFNAKSGFDDGDFYRFITADGTSVFFKGNIYIDIGGPNKGSHQGGKDVFCFYIVDNNIRPSCFNLKDYFCVKSKGSDCTQWVINFGNMDYLIADKDGKCNNNP